MTLFEYLSVAVSIVLSFGAVRLVDALPSVYARERRYWPHALWVINLLWLHVQFWWVFWSYSRVATWTYLQFLLAVAGPGLLYAGANTAVSSSPSTVISWEAHFYLIRRRFFLLGASFLLVIGLSGWQILGLPLVHPVRAIQASGILLSLTAARWSGPALHWAFALLATAFLLATTIVLSRGGFGLPPS